MHFENGTRFSNNRWRGEVLHLVFFIVFFFCLSKVSLYPQLANRRTQLEETLCKRGMLLSWPRRPARRAFPVPAHEGGTASVGNVSWVLLAACQVYYLQPVDGLGAESA